MYTSKMSKKGYGLCLSYYRWMDDFYQQYLVISSQWKYNNERLSAIKPCLWLEKNTARPQTLQTMSNRKEQNRTPFIFMQENMSGHTQVTYNIHRLKKISFSQILSNDWSISPIWDSFMIKKTSIHLENVYQLINPF